MRLSRLSRWPRRLLAVVLLVSAALVAIRPDRPGAVRPPAGKTVLVAARDLPPGRILSPADVRRVQIPADLVPYGVLRPGAAVAGRELAAPVRKGEPLTDVRLTGAPLTAAIGGQGAEAVPVRLADADIAALLRSGDRVDVIMTSVDPPGRSAVIARDVAVLAVPRARDTAPTDGAVVVLAAPETSAARLAGLAATARLTVTLHPP